MPGEKEKSGYTGASAQETGPKREKWDAFGNSDIADSVLPQDTGRRLENVLFDMQTYHVDPDNYEFVEPRVANPDWEQWIDYMQERCKDNITLLDHMNGRRGQALRLALRNNTSNAATYLTNLYGWFVESTKSRAEEHRLNKERHIDPTIAQRADAFKFYFNTQPEPGKETSTLPSKYTLLISKPPEILLAVKHDANLLYERVMFLGKFPDTNNDNYEQRLLEETAQALGNTSRPLSWNNLVHIVFNAAEPKTELLLEKIGFIPQSLAVDAGRGKAHNNRVAFSKLEPTDIIPSINQLKDLGNDKNNFKARFERARLLNRFIVSGAAKKDRFPRSLPVQLDSNGIFIHLQSISAHIPYGLISPELLEELKKPSEQWYKNPDAIVEIEQRIAEENSDVQKIRATRTEAVRVFSIQLGLENNADALAKMVVEKNETIARLIVKHGLTLPDLVIDRTITLFGDAGAYALARYAEIVGLELLKTATGARSTTAHKKIAASAEYYPAIKIAQRLLERKTLRALTGYTPAEHRLSLQRRVPKGTQSRRTLLPLAYLEASSNGATAAILVNEKKSLDNIMWNEFIALPEAPQAP